VLGFELRIKRGERVSRKTIVVSLYIVKLLSSEKVKIACEVVSVETIKVSAMVVVLPSVSEDAAPVPGSPITTVPRTEVTSLVKVVVALIIYQRILVGIKIDSKQKMPKADSRIIQAVRSILLLITT
jgi:hypothetical protein